MQRWLARAIYYPTLGYNLLLGRCLGVRRWWDDIDQHVVLGARPVRRDPHRFKQMGVTGVINTCDEFPGPLQLYQQLGIEQLWLPTVDFNHPSREHIEQGAAFIEKHVLLGGKVYVHCKAGRARSATVVLWWLVRYRQLTPDQAQAAILRARPHSNPTIYQRPVIQHLYAEFQQLEKIEDSA